MRMNPGIGKDSVLWRNRYASRRIAVDHKEVIVIEIGIPPSVEMAPRVFEKDGISRAGVHGPCVILQQEIIAVVGGQDDFRDGVGPSEQKGAETVDNLWMKGTPNVDVAEKI